VLPEEKFAKRLLEKYGLSPPVDVEVLLCRYADLEFDHIPRWPDGSRLADAVCEKRRGARPQVIVHRTNASARLRFTLAHELGHVIIPWHVGVLIEPVGFLSQDAEENSLVGIVGDAEREANRFAAELLMPREFTAKLCREYSPSDAVAELILQAQVSTQAALIRAMPLLPPATVLAMSEQGGGVQWCRRTAGTPVAALPNGAILSDGGYFPGADETGSTVLPDGRILYFWRFGMPKPVPPLGEKHWRELADEIAEDVCDFEYTSSKIKQSLSGIIGTVHSRCAEQGAEAIYGQILMRCQLRSRTDEVYGRIVGHPSFSEFIIARVYSLQPGYKDTRKKKKKMINGIDE
jgi:hypothetical protein